MTESWHSMSVFHISQNFTMQSPDLLRSAVWSSYERGSCRLCDITGYCLSAAADALGTCGGNSRLLTSWCWRERLAPAFSASPLNSRSEEVPQELLLSFDASQGVQPSVLSMAVQRSHTGGWAISLQVGTVLPQCAKRNMIVSSDHAPYFPCPLSPC